MQEVVDNYTKANIPLDVMWGDIDYMERWRDFTFDPVNFPLPALQVCMHGSACFFHAALLIQPCLLTAPALDIHTQGLTDSCASPPLTLSVSSDV